LKNNFRTEWFKIKNGIIKMLKFYLFFFYLFIKNDGAWCNSTCPEGTCGVDSAPKFLQNQESLSQLRSSLCTHYPRFQQTIIFYFSKDENFSNQTNVMELNFQIQNPDKIFFFIKIIIIKKKFLLKPNFGYIKNQKF
jgi:hypothetical protein